MNALLSKEFAQFYTALVWIIFWAVLLIVWRTRMSSAIEAVIKRIQTGSAVSVGIVKLEGAPKEIREGPAGSVAVSDPSHPKAIPEGMSVASIDEEYKRLIDEQYFLLHAAEVVRERTSPRSGLYRVRVWVESYHDKPLNDITKVTYRVWGDAKPPIISTTYQEKDFELWMSMYGEFPVLAYIERKGKPGVWVTRYLDLPGRPPD
jgi:hypothetical protein